MLGSRPIAVRTSALLEATIAQYFTPKGAILPTIPILIATSFLLCPLVLSSVLLLLCHLVSTAINLYFITVLNSIIVTITIQLSNGDSECQPV